MKFKFKKLGSIVGAVLYLFSYSLAAMIENYPNNEEFSFACSMYKQRTSSLSPLSSQLQPCICPQDFEYIILKRYPIIFRGIDNINPSAFMIRSKGNFFVNDVSREALPHTTLYTSLCVQHMEDFFKKHVGRNPTYINRFLSEIKFQKEINDISFSWLWVMHLRFAASVSVVNFSEKDFYKNVSIRELYHRLLKHDAWKSYTASMAAVSGHSAQEFTVCSLSSSLSRSSLDTIDKCLPMEMLYPVLGAGKFSPPFLVKAYINNIFPIGIPVQEQMSHGVLLSPLGFSAHDNAHFDLDPRSSNLKVHIVERVETYINQGFEITDILHLYLPIANKKYQALMSYFNKIYQELVIQFLPRVGVKEFKKAIAGFFQIMHEKPNFPPTLYEMNDLDEVLALVTKQPEKNETEDNPFHTTPHDGISKMTDKEIADWVIKNKAVEMAQEYRIIPTFGNITNLSSLGKRIKSFKVARSNRFINVRFMLQDGQKLTYAFPTLYYEWHNADDGIALLKFAGVPFEKPNLEDAIDAAQVARSTIDNVENRLQDCVNYFHKVAMFFSHLDSQKTNNNLTQRYWKWHFSQEQWLKEKLPHARKKLK